jgi:hypothetical protein
MYGEYTAGKFVYAASGFISEVILIVWEDVKVKAIPVTGRRGSHLFSRQ